MKWLVVVGLVAVSTAAGAQSGFWAGGVADGIASSERLRLQERAIELDARDGGDRYWRLRTEQQLDAIERQLKRNNDFLDPRRRVLR